MKQKQVFFAILTLSMGLASAVAGQLKEFTTLLSFDGTNGAEPVGKLIESRAWFPSGPQSFYGTTYGGGVLDGGTVFSVSPSGTISNLHYFSFATEGANPNAGLVLASDGNLYGTATWGLTNSGTIFRISRTRPPIPPIVLHPIPIGNPINSPAFPIGPIPITFFGAYTNLHAFSGPDGAHPLAGPLIQAEDGFLYGTTVAGGSNDIGSIFRISTNGSFESIYSFNNAGGFVPDGGLVEGSDGNFYGTAQAGGPDVLGTVFKITPSGVYTDLFAFHGSDGAVPYGGLVQGVDGSFYGTTMQGGPSYGDTNSINGQGFGTIFTITTNGVLTTLFSFAETNGSYPYGPLIQATDGRLYGTTLCGGPYTNNIFGVTGDVGFGTLFCITTNGEFTTLHSFDGTNGASPFATPLQATDGSFYATTELGGAYDLGTVYRFRVSLPPALSAPPPMITTECGRTLLSLFNRVTNYNETPVTAVWSVNQIPVETNSLPPASVSPVYFPQLASFSLGTNILTLTCSDDDGDSASCSMIVNVVDTTPPQIGVATARPSVLWPPRGQMVNVEVTALLLDWCSHSTYKITGVSSPGISSARKGRTTYWKITGDHTVALRAEGGAGGRDRVYNITLQATDAAGNVSLPKVVTVTVQRNKPAPDK